MTPDVPPPSVDFDTNPPVPVAQYAESVRRFNVGYELVFVLVHAFLRDLARHELELLVVGAGGGAEIAAFAPPNPGWRITGVDPSAQMLALAKERVDRLGLAGRVRLVQGTTDDLPAAAAFDAATSLYVLHFLPEEASKAHLRSIAHRLRPNAPLLVVSGVRDGGRFERFEGVWRQYGELNGMTAEEAAATLQRIKVRPPGPSEERYESQLREAGFVQVDRFFNALTSTGWVARRGS
jgi:tRNA (cmo5U34)-methyltransferase